MLFDQTLLFFHTGTAYNMTSGEAMSLVGVGTASSSTGLVINLGNARDLGIGPGEEIPQVAVNIASAITSSCASMQINAQFQGSTDSTHWTTYAETGAASTASFAAGAAVFPLAVPRRPSGVALPLYYRMNVVVTGANAGETISTGSIIGGIVLARADSAGTLDQYGAGFTVV
jgi:hypothetical protein